MRKLVVKSMSKKLAYLFNKYRFFNEFHSFDGVYGVLLEVYNSLPDEIKLLIRSYSLNLDSISVASTKEIAATVSEDTPEVVENSEPDAGSVLVEYSELVSAHMKAIEYIDRVFEKLIFLSRGVDT